MWQAYHKSTYVLESCLLFVLFMLKIFLLGSHSVIHYDIFTDLSGRVKEGSRKKDFADTDLKLALNACIRFQTPEKFFLGSNQTLHTQFNVADSVRLCDVVRQKNDIFQYY